MSASIKAAHDAAAAAYERHINDNWDRLAPFEQEHARAYIQANFEGVTQAPMQPISHYPGFPNPNPDPMYGDGYGLYGGLGLRPGQEDEGTWAIPVGYLGVLFFVPLAIGCGIYNITKGRTGHGAAQILLPVAFFIFSLAFFFAAL